MTLNFKPVAEIAPLINKLDDHFARTCDDSTVLAIACGAAQTLRKRGLKVGILVKALIDAAGADAVEEIPYPRGQG